MYLELHKGRRQKKWCFGVVGALGEGGGVEARPQLSTKKLTLLFLLPFEGLFSKK